MISSKPIYEKYSATWQSIGSIIAILPRLIATLTVLSIIIALSVRKSKIMINSHDF